mmetsp:Transcript_4916/g.17838  ORF Transcript_4916/g.17838 Transcript_4916/m.17838 type:complete len:448 (+) Transcript_4916:33-1376(+)
MGDSSDFISQTIEKFDRDRKGKAKVEETNVKRVRFKEPEEDDADDVEDYEQYAERRAAKKRRADEDEEDNPYSQSGVDAFDAAEKRRVARSEIAAQMKTSKEKGYNEAGEEEQTLGADYSEGGVTFEPFNLKKEREEGYFDDAGNYIENGQEEEVEDAWLDSAEVKDSKGNESIVTSVSKINEAKPLTAEEIADLKMDVVRILQPREKVLQALKRLGGKQQSRDSQKAGGKSSRFSKTISTILPENKAAFEKLTEASSILLDAGEYNIYNDRKEDLERDCSAFRATSAARDKLLDGNVEDDMFADSDDEAGEKPAVRAEGTKTPSAVQPSAADGSTSGSGDAANGNDFVYDETSGYYFSSRLGLYYDSQSGLYFNGTTGQWLKYEGGQYTVVACETGTSKPSATKGEIEDMSVKQLKHFLSAHAVDTTDCLEKEHLQEKAKELASDK